MCFDLSQLVCYLTPNSVSLSFSHIYIYIYICVCVCVNELFIGSIIFIRFSTHFSAQSLTVLSIAIVSLIILIICWLTMK